MNKLLPKLAYLIIGVALLLLVLFIYWSIYPYKPLTLSNIKLNKTEVNRGEHLQVSFDYCKTVDLSADMYITFIDGVIYNTPPQVSNLPKGCGSGVISIYVPRALPTGEFMLKGVFKYKVNPIRSVEANGLTEKFIILK